MTSDCSIAISAPALTATEIPSGLDSQPPVSITMNLRPPHSHSYWTRSRVTPGVSSTIASRLPINRFINVDFPTFGLPKIPTIGKPSKFLSRNNSHTRSTVSSKLSSVESINTASAAICRGEALRVVSIKSRPSKDSLTSSVDVRSSISASRRCARASRSAVR